LENLIDSLTAPSTTWATSSTMMAPISETEYLATIRNGARKNSSSQA
jgi:hypothetical protein